MLDTQMKRAKTERKAKNPEEDYKAGFYYCEDGSYGFISRGFKKALVRAGTYCGLPMTKVRGALYVLGEHVHIEGEPRMRRDMVRVGKGTSKTADIRFRPEFPEWTAVLPISYNASTLNKEQIANLVSIAGYAVGIGDWRPEKDGEYGRFKIAPSAFLSD